MLRGTLLFSTAALLALTAGRAFWVWVGESPFGMSGTTYVDFFQQLDRRIAIPIAVVGVLGPVFAGAAAAVHRSDRRTFWLLVSACMLATVSALVTGLLNVPINEQIAGWNPNALPPGYEDLLRQWWNWHMVRTVTSMAAMCCALLAPLTSGGRSVVPAA